MSLHSLTNTYVLPVRVYYEDTDHGGVVYYANYLKFMERCRTEFLRSRGFEQDRLIQESDLIFAVSRAEIDYRKPAGFNDLLLVTAEVSDKTRVKMTFRQQVYKVVNDTENPHSAMQGYFESIEKISEHGTLLCDARVSIAALSASTMRPKRLPQSIFEELMCEC